MRTICITGGDGTGKSTQCESLKIHITALGKSVIHASIWDALPILQAHLKSNATTEDVQKYLVSLDSTSRYMFFLHALSLSLNKAIACNPDFILLDSYWYKYAALESLLGQNINDLASCSKVLPTPDDIIFLDLEPKIALSRKKQDGLSQYEGSNEAEFLKRQNNSQKIWKELQEERWHVLNADQDLDHLQDEIRKVLNL